MRYTVEHATETGKVDPKWGTEYLVKFNEDERVIKMNRKYPPRPGSEFIGDIIAASWGNYFKKSQDASNTTIVPQPPQPKTQKPQTFTMYVSYAKDLLSSYMESLNWDIDKYDPKAFYNIVEEVGAVARMLRESESDPNTLTVEEVVDSWK